MKWAAKTSKLLSLNLYFIQQIDRKVATCRSQLISFRVNMFLWLFVDSPDSHAQEVMKRNFVKSNASSLYFFQYTFKHRSSYLYFFNTQKRVLTFKILHLFLNEFSASNGNAALSHCAVSAIPNGESVCNSNRRCRIT